MTPRARQLARIGLTLSAGAFAAIVAVAAGSRFRYAGSDTLEPVVGAAAVAFERGHAGFKMQIASAGTSTGFKELCNGNVALAGASRPIKSDESQVCATNKVRHVEIPAALDAIVMAVSVKNTWLKDLTLGEVRTLFDPASVGRVTSWKQIRPTFPDLPIRPAGVGIKHGTFSFFSESIGLNGFLRSDYKDFPNHAGTGNFVAGDAGAVGFIPIGDAKSMESQIRPIAIDFGAGPVSPTADNVNAGKYDKLARTVYIYLNPSLLSKEGPQEQEFTKVLITDLEKYVRFANLIPLSAVQYRENAKRYLTAP